MANQQLLDYVVKGRRAGATDAQIRQKLSEVGWHENDIADALSQSAPAVAVPDVSSARQTVSPVQTAQPRTAPAALSVRTAEPFRSAQNAFPSYYSPSPAAPNAAMFRPQSSKGSGTGKKGIVFGIVAAIVLILAGAGFAYVRFFRAPAAVSQPPAQTPPPSNSAAGVSSSPQSGISASSGPDVSAVRTALEEIRQGYLTSDKALILKHASAATAILLSAGTSPSASAFAVDTVFPSSSSTIVANLSIVSGNTTSTPQMVFIQENGEWKFDLAATFQYAQNHAAVSQPVKNPSKSF